MARAVSLFYLLAVIANITFFVHGCVEMDANFSTCGAFVPFAEREHAVITARLAALRVEDEKEVWSHLKPQNKSAHATETAEEPLP